MRLVDHLLAEYFVYRILCTKRHSCLIPVIYTFHQSDTFNYTRSMLCNACFSADYTNLELHMQLETVCKGSILISILWYIHEDYTVKRPIWTFISECVGLRELHLRHVLFAYQQAHVSVPAVNHCSGVSCQACAAPSDGGGVNLSFCSLWNKDLHLWAMDWRFAVQIP